MTGNPNLDVGSFLGTADLQPCANDDEAGLDAGVVDCEEAKSEIQSKEMLLRIQNAYLKQIKEEHNLRKKFVPYVYWLVVGLLASTLLILITNGILCACGKQFLSDGILMALMGSTLADIIGILYIAIRWLFVSSIRH